MIRTRRGNPISTGRAIATGLSVLLLAPPLWADEGTYTEGDEDRHLQFMHPLVSDSPSPTTTLGFDYALTKKTHEGDEVDHGMKLEGEIAPARWISFEMELPYTISDRDEEANRHNLDNLELFAKFASFALEDEGILFGGGLGLTLPTGNSKNEIGSDRLVVIEPFFDAGFKRGIFEAVGFLRFGIPTNENSRDPDWMLRWNLSFLVHASSMFAGLLEFDGNRGWGGEEDGETIANITPGLRWNPSDDPNLWFGTGVSLPLTNDEDFDVRWRLIAFYQF
jgi:hypothetical protein